MRLKTEAHLLVCLRGSPFDGLDRPPVRDDLRRSSCLIRNTSSKLLDRCRTLLRVRDLRRLRSAYSRKKMASTGAVSARWGVRGPRLPCLILRPNKRKEDALVRRRNSRRSDERRRPKLLFHNYQAACESGRDGAGGPASLQKGYCNRKTVDSEGLEVDCDGEFEQDGDETHCAFATSGRLLGVRRSFGGKKDKSIGKHCLQECSKPHSSTQCTVLVTVGTVHRAEEHALAREFQKEFPDRCAIQRLPMGHIEFLQAWSVDSIPAPSSSLRTDVMRENRCPGGETMRRLTSGERRDFIPPSSKLSHQFHLIFIELDALA